MLTDKVRMTRKKLCKKQLIPWGFPGGAVVKNLPADAGDTGSILVWEDPTCCGATKPVYHNY